jgi:ABC-type transport system involved in multi-copper enzyme maturation permease subunit
MKVKNYRTFWILLGMMVVSVPGLSYVIFNLMNNSFPKTKNGKSLLGSPFAFPDAWQTVSWNSTLLFILPAILIITLTTNEFTYKTHRQNIIDGWSRKQFIGVKLIEVLLLSLLSTFVVLVTVLGFGFIANKLPAGISVWQESRFLLFYFVQALSYFTIAFLLSMLIKRSGLAIGAFLIYMLLENIVVGIFHNVYHINAMEYMPEEVTDRLIPFPYVKSLGLVDVIRWEHLIPGYLAVAALYLITYCLITGRSFLRRDL